MNQIEEVKLAEKFYEKALKTLTKKAHDYAQDQDCFSNFTKIAATVEIPVEKVFMVFMVVKIARITELLKKGKTEVGESIEDSLMDLANYSCLLSLYNEDDSLSGPPLTSFHL